MVLDILIIIITMDAQEFSAVLLYPPRGGRILIVELRTGHDRMGYQLGARVVYLLRVILIIPR